MAIRHRTFSFSSVDTAGITDEMRSFAVGADGRRWMNIVPDADEADIHTGSIAWRIFSSRGPVIPQFTWFPSHPGRQRQEPAQLGLAHATGRGAVERLEKAGLSAPGTWELIQDHQKRGIIFLMRPEADDGEIVEYATVALRHLSPFGFEDAFLATFSQQ